MRGMSDARKSSITQRPAPQSEAKTAVLRPGGSTGKRVATRSTNKTSPAS